VNKVSDPRSLGKRRYVHVEVLLCKPQGTPEMRHTFGSTLALWPRVIFVTYPEAQTSYLFYQPARVRGQRHTPSSTCDLKENRQRTILLSSHTLTQPSAWPWPPVIEIVK
jgi:hypothetical protein